MKRKNFVVVRLAAMAAVLGLLASCHTVQPYVAPTDGDTVKLLIRPVLPAGMGFGVYAFEDQHACRNPRRIVAGNASSGNQSSTLRAGPLTTLAYIGSERTRSCVISFSFYPKARHTYLLATSQDSERCAVRLLDATDGDNLHAEKSFVRRTMKGSSCEPLNKNLRSVESINETYQGTQKGEGKSGVNGLDDFKDLLPK